jgi:hypothetical protein
MPTRGRTITWCCAALLVVRIVAVGTALDQQATSGRHTVLPGDVRRYHQIAQHRGTPYVDFLVEYPPLTLGAIEALDGHTVRDATVHLMWSQVVLDGLIALLLAWGWGRRAALVYLLLGLAFVWYPFLYLRLDLLSVALAVGGLALVRRRFGTTGGAMVGLACFAKVWPLALAPGLVARRSWRAMAAFVAVGVGGLAAWVGWAGVDGPVQVLTFRGARGWQVESTVGAVVHVLAGPEARIERGAARIGAVPDWAKVGLPALALLVVVGVWWLVRRRPLAPVHVVDGVAPVAAIAALLVGATLLSPQYVSWLLPFAAIAAAGGERAIGWLTAAVALLSTLDLNLVKEVNRGLEVPMAIVLVRNLVLVGLLVYAIVRVAHPARRAAPARVALPAPPVVAPVPARAVAPPASDGPPVPVRVS